MNSPLAQELVLPCGQSINNRLGKSAMTEGLADSLDRPTPAHNQLYNTWSHGGTGLHITGNVMVDRRYLERAGNVVLEDDSALEQFKQWAQAGTEAGNHLWMQISHPGRQCPSLVNKQPLSPSEVHLKMLGSFSKPRALTQVEIAEIIQRYATTAALAKEAGFTGVQVHCAHGYLISQFLSPKTNQRSDQWGGSLENRARFARKVVQAVRKAVGPDFPVAVKLNSADFQKGGFSLEDCVQVAAWLAQDSIDLLEISGGTYEQLSLMGVEATEVRESTRKREAYFLEYAAAIKASAKVPLMITGGFRSRDVMEQAISSGEIDMVGLARPLCTQPNISQQLLEQSVDRIDDFEHNLTLGNGWLGNNSSISLIKAINNVGAVSFYYQQIMRLSKNKPVDTSLKVLPCFAKHMINDTKLNLQRKKAQNKSLFSTN
ncbi:NADH:flavin oxidoreductase/NADH oxidase family protein [Thalassomonas sp. M1454]|uniref:NADH:flavin oxidoreductase/NADH oxidase family protein n=1 Tax=Thalassomonas sp. M1454 TaxID=2594477 RepID=UPI00117CC8F3|nr:NADH:flavin oxidoreductase/NADH oxidase family protein [Thalassomonas sp. M1454]TRX55127.1 NADH:flavin oxidoreductase/NADH oxidase family protein [Thalassomonas sp. M1454]